MKEEKSRIHTRISPETERKMEFAILDAILQPLAFMLVLLQFGGSLGVLFFQFLA